jgi:aldose sugar dehydrogenase
VRLFIAALFLMSAVVLIIPANINAQTIPAISDENLAIELFADGLSIPTSMTFIDAGGNLLVTQKNDGRVMFVSGDGTVFEQPVIQFNVNSVSERGLLGIASINEAQIRNLPADMYEGRDYVFLFMTEAENGDPAANRVYRFEWDAQSRTLSNQQLILDLPVLPGPNHDGGKVTLDSDGYLYAVIGDLNRNGVLQNNPEGPDPDDTSVIIRTDLDGGIPHENPFSGDKVEYYYAYGIRNSFGLAIDPLTGTLWDTENGPADYDEVNIVRPGFNSGWSKVMGPLSRSDAEVDSLVTLPGSHYADPLISWRQGVGITDIEFLNSTTLGEEYAYDIFVGDYNGGNLYHFDVNSSRDDVLVDGIDGLEDRVIDSWEELLKVRLASFDAGITDIKTGPDGFLYILTFDGKIYRIVPSR